METINFFKDEEKIEEKCFGLCDDFDEQAKTPAYCSINLEEKENWIATVSNKTDNSIAFIAVDNKIELRRANGEMDYRCDAMLHNEDYIVFVELKNQLIRQGRYTDPVDDLIFKVINAPVRKLKIDYSNCSYIAGLYDAFRIIAVLFPQKWDVEKIREIFS